MLSYRVDGKRLIASTPVMPRGGGAALHQIRDG